MNEAFIFFYVVTIAFVLDHLYCYNTVYHVSMIGATFLNLFIKDFLVLRQVCI